MDNIPLFHWAEFIVDFSVAQRLRTVKKQCWRAGWQNNDHGFMNLLTKIFDVIAIASEMRFTIVHSTQQMAVFKFYSLPLFGRVFRWLCVIPNWWWWATANYFTKVLPFVRQYLFEIAYWNVWLLGGETSSLNVRDYM